MIVLTIIVDETDKQLSTEGFFTAIKPTRREEQLATDLLKAIESYCMKRGKEGAVFMRRELPSTNETEDKGE